MMAEAARLLGSSDDGKVIPNLTHHPTSVSQFTSEVRDNPSCIEGKGEIYKRQAILRIATTTTDKISSIPAHANMNNEDVPN